MFEGATAVLDRHPKTREHKYGTAGFRANASGLEPVFVRMGLLAWCRALVTGAAVGLMTTASHNPVADNGVKLIDPDGGMLEASWEAFATEVANAPDTATVLVLLEARVAQAGAVAGGGGGGGGKAKEDAAPHVFLGYDTRPHSLPLSTLAQEAIAAVGGTVTNSGLLTTPQLHFIVQARNSPDPERRALATEAGYYKFFATSFADMVESLTSNNNNNNNNNKEPLHVVVDCANGVGGPKFRQLLDAHPSAFAKHVTFELRNVDDASKLNLGVGAEHVQKKRALPEGTVDPAKDANTLFASFDGDADRIVFYFVDDATGAMHLLDGDKISALYAGYISRALAPSSSSASSSSSSSSPKQQLKVGVVQTAYANGASRVYFEQECPNLETALVKTGVKHLHAKAHEYDVAVYFEANGHGTAVFNGSAGRDNARLAALQRVLNQATGDAIADLLGAVAILRVDGVSMRDWDVLYRELPSRQLKVQVKDRAIITTTSDETRALSPDGLQDAVDACVAACPAGGHGNGGQPRAFVRPSGTENVVRVYAEAGSDADADALALAVCQAVYDVAGGVGGRPGGAKGETASAAKRAKA